MNARIELSGYLVDLSGDETRSAYGVVTMTGSDASIAFHPPTAIFGDTTTFPTRFRLTTSDGVVVILVGCFARRVNSKDEVGIATANRALIFGQAADANVPLQFSQATASIRGLREWMGASVGGSPTVTINANLGDLHCVLTASTLISNEMMSTQEEVRASVRITSPVVQDPEFWLDTVMWLSHLVSICAGRTCAFDNVEVATDDYAASLWFLPTELKRDPEATHPLKWPFVLGTDAVASVAIIERWFAARANIRTLANLFLEDWLRPVTLMEFRFISLLQGLESYHRKVFAGKDCYIDTSEYELIYNQVTAAIPSGVDPDLNLSLESRLKFGNEHSLRRRMKTLLAHHDGAKSAIMDAFGMINAVVWIEKIVGLRNELTHYSGSWKYFEKEYKRIRGRVSEIHVLCWYLLLYEALGDSDRALEAICRTPDFQQAGRLRGERSIDWVGSAAPAGDASDVAHPRPSRTEISQPSLLPPNLMEELMREFSLAPGRVVGAIRKLLVQMCQTGTILAQQHFAYYVEIVRSHDLLNAAHLEVQRMPPRRPVGSHR